MHMHTYTVLLLYQYALSPDLPVYSPQFLHTGLLACGSTPLPAYSALIPLLRV
eukprot:TRINITY_DN1718_c0_g1_i1.p1 TRINITY_DN1718_c0_g1~~TRINITY_DN1718_c0_g1_i1.p1  ORF type:complete len:53 (+),score=25.91 TRINITY_DN1718_c0_g1_i1:209-367(+)